MGNSPQYYSKEVLVEAFAAQRCLLFIFALLMRGEPCAYDLVFKVEGKKWGFFDCINGGYDPTFAYLNIGNISMYLNI